MNHIPAFLFINSYLPSAKGFPSSNLLDSNPFMISIGPDL